MAIRITSPDRVVYPSVGITKLAVAQYYQAVAPWMLPYVTGRPLSLVRCPQGLHPDEECFYQKHAMRGLSDVVERVVVPTAEGGQDTQLAVADADGLVALVQFGVLEFHIWGSRYESPDEPDMIVFDLDPDESLRWTRVVTAAFWIRRELDGLGLTSFVKTTGGKGLHITLPLAAGHTWSDVEGFAARLCARLQRAEPTAFTTEHAKSKRGGRILLDYLRNVRGSTSVAPYSTRARPGAPVSTPITWDELKSVARGSFQLGNVPQRLAALSEDPWAGYHDVEQEVSPDMLR